MDIRNIYASHPLLKPIVSELSDKAKKHLHLKGLKYSAEALFIAECFQRTHKQIVVTMTDKEEAAYLYNDLTHLISENDVLFFSSSYKRTINYEYLDSGGIVSRTDVMNRMNQWNTEKINPYVVVTFPEALTEKVVTVKSLNNNTLVLKVGEEVSQKEVVEFLSEYGFQRGDFVYEPGQYAIRGSLIDIYSFAHEFPFRIDFFGDEIESIRAFNISQQLSVSKMQQVSIIPDIQTQNVAEERISFFDFIPDDTIVWSADIKYLIERLTMIYNKSVEQNPKLPDGVTLPDLLITGSHIPATLEKMTTVETSATSFFSNSKHYDFRIKLQPDFNKNFSLLIDNIIDRTNNGFTVYILSEKQKQLERLKDIFEAESKGAQVIFTPIESNLHTGFVDSDMQICCYTDHQIFQRYHKFNLKSSTIAQGREALTFNEISNLHPGDFVVHVDHGVGQFAGLTKIEINGKWQESIAIKYKDGDILYASIQSLHRISKFKSKEGEPPTVHKLGSGVWQKLTQRTKSKVKDIAAELIKLYAQRRAEDGFAFSADSYLQEELEASFMYEDTPDQEKATIAVKSDMESPHPMDRLICGDVGFGKTEIAIRAAFKAVTDNKQVAILVPTTILALQHYKTFSERLKEFPCRVEYISRLKSAKQQKEIIKEVESGKVDIIIGTHRVVSNDIKFKDLGLLVIDEEQKFGVALKEKLRKVKLNVDTITMSATPIPRTMQFSLMGARDLSIINTPPPNRYPIITEIHTFNDEVVREAIDYELSRNGQVFFIHNRVQNINEVEKMVQRICPEARTVVGHGQMKGAELEDVMLAFMSGEFDVLIATTIVESGLDIPNANTIIINNAQNFGISDLHQLRGRVGRSNTKAFCYLLAPPLSTLPDDSRRRLKAIEDFSELGSGFNIALQDLDIRGAGNLLGGEQSGFIADIGFENYQRILDETLIELRENEFKDLYENEDAQLTDSFDTDAKGKIRKREQKIKYVADCQIDTDLEMMFPDSYISNVAERMRLYKELDSISNETELSVFKNNLIDRFGKIPKQGLDLISIVRLRWQAIELGIGKFILKRQKMICHFGAEKNSSFYSSRVFSAILAYVQKNKHRCRFREGEEKLMIIFEPVNSIDEAAQLLKNIEI